MLQEEDEEGHQGVNLSKQLVKVAGRVLKLNITRTAPLILPLSQKLQFLSTLLRRKVRCTCLPAATKRQHAGQGIASAWLTCAGGVLLSAPGIEGTSL